MELGSVEETPKYYHTLPQVPLVKFAIPPQVTEIRTAEEAQAFDPDARPGYKEDGAKPRTDLVQPRPVLRLAIVLGFGAKKYADRNWEKGMKWSRVYGALLRHMFSWWTGQDKDPETGYSHLDHAAACIHFLQHYEETRKEFDDRPKTA